MSGLVSYMFTVVNLAQVHHNSSSSRSIPVRFFWWPFSRKKVRFEKKHSSLRYTQHVSPQCWINCELGMLNISLQECPEVSEHQQGIPYSVIFHYNNNVFTSRETLVKSMLIKIWRISYCSIHLGVILCLPKNRSHVVCGWYSRGVGTV